MVVSVKLFGPQARLVGQPQLELELPGQQATVQEVLTGLEDREPRLAASLSGSRVAVNQVFVASDAVIGAEDEVALIGMVGGG
jgi:molybdopterin converting factor small subunit